MVVRYNENVTQLFKLLLMNSIVGKLLESKIQEAKSKKDTLKARAQSAKYASLLFAFSFA